VFEFRQGQRFFSFPKRQDRLLGPRSLLFTAYQCTFPGHDVNHSRPSSAEVKNGWSYTSAPPICLHGVDREAFTLPDVLGNFIGTP
jgi:hypothetical protein